MHPHVEAAEQLHEPLVYERFRHQDQDPVRPSAQQQAMQDQTCLDGFAQADFVGQQDAGRVPVGDLLGDINLMWDQVNAAAYESAYRRLARAVEQFRRTPDTWAVDGVDISMPETIFKCDNMVILGRR